MVWKGGSLPGIESLLWRVLRYQFLNITVAIRLIEETSEVIKIFVRKKYNNYEVQKSRSSVCEECYIFSMEDSAMKVSTGSYRKPEL